MDGWWGGQMDGWMDGWLDEQMMDTLNSAQQCIELCMYIIYVCIKCIYCIYAYILYYYIYYIYIYKKGSFFLNVFNSSHSQISFAHHSWVYCPRVASTSQQLLCVWFNGNWLHLVKHQPVRQCILKKISSIFS